MMGHQILALLCILSAVSAIAIMVRLKFVVLRDELTLARHTINVLHPKAYAWDQYLASRRQPGMTAKAAADVEERFRTAYDDQHVPHHPV